MRNLGLVFLIVLAAACGGYYAAQGGVVTQKILTIKNETDNQVAVYAEPSKRRIATVVGFGAERVVLREADLYAGEELTLRLRALAATSEYTTPTLLLYGDLEAVLVIRGVAFSGLQSSTLYTRTP